MNEKIEKRVIALSGDTQFRAIEEDGKKFIEGYAAIFDSRSKLLMENREMFYEDIKPGAFRNVLDTKDLDVYLTFNHSRDLVMARTVNGTLSLNEDDKGLFFRAEIPNVSYANDTYELVKNGTYFENSFAFTVDKEDVDWNTDEDIPLRSVRNIKRLYDVSVVTNGAYAETSVTARDLPEYEEEEVPEEVNFKALHKMRSNEIENLK